MWVLGGLGFVEVWRVCILQEKDDVLAWAEKRGYNFAVSPVNNLLLHYKSLN